MAVHLGALEAHRGARNLISHGGFLEALGGGCSLELVRH
jgi:hypothetical protein